MATRYPQDKVIAEIEQLQGWEYDPQSEVIFTEIEFPDFDTSISFIYGITNITSELNHYPELILHDFRFLRIILWSPQVSGVSEMDFAFARSLERVLSTGVPPQPTASDQQPQVNLVAGQPPEPETTQPTPEQTTKTVSAQAPAAVPTPAPQPVPNTPTPAPAPTAQPTPSTTTATPAVEGESASPAATSPTQTPPKPITPGARAVLPPKS